MEIAMPSMQQQMLAPGARSIDIDTLADEVAFWTRMVARDPRIDTATKAEIAASFARGLALTRAAVQPTGGRVDPGAAERFRRAVLLGAAQRAQRDLAAEVFQHGGRFVEAGAKA